VPKRKDSLNRTPLAKVLDAIKQCAPARCATAILVVGVAGALRRLELVADRRRWRAAHGWRGRWT